MRSFARLLISLLLRRRLRLLLFLQHELFLLQGIGLPLIRQQALFLFPLFLLKLLLLQLSGLLLFLQQQLFLLPLFLLNLPLLLLPQVVAGDLPVAMILGGELLRPIMGGRVCPSCIA